MSDPKYFFSDGEFDMDGKTTKADPETIGEGDFIMLTGHPNFADTDVMQVFKTDEGLSIVSAEGDSYRIGDIVNKPSCLFSLIVDEGGDVSPDKEPDEHTKKPFDPNAPRRELLSGWRATNIRYAAKIESVQRKNERSSGWVIVNGGKIRVTSAYLDKFDPQEGGYYIVYRPDTPKEYVSYCPGEEFEEDHELAD